MKKKILASILAVAMMFTLTACGSSQAGVQMKEDGSIMTYTEEDLPEGLYVKSGDTYYPLLNATEADAAEANYQWFTEFDQLIPEMGEDDTLILYSTSEVPQSFTFWKMTDFGYTVGIRFQQAETSKDLTFPSDQNGYCSYSPVGTYILETTFGGAGVSNVKIEEVNGKEFKETMLTTDGFMKGLTKDAMYKFWYYQGTVYKSVNIKADTHVFIEDYDLSTASYVELKDKFFEVNLPNGIENGYWFVEGYGMFKYSGAETDLILEDADSESPINEDELIEPETTEQDTGTDISEQTETNEESQETVEE